MHSTKNIWIGSKLVELRWEEAGKFYLGGIRIHNALFHVAMFEVVERNDELVPRYEVNEPELDAMAGLNSTGGKFQTIDLFGARWVLNVIPYRG